VLRGLFSLKFLAEAIVTACTIASELKLVDCYLVRILS